MMHYHATEEDHAKLERKGFLLVDSGATYLDGTTDITRTFTQPKQPLAGGRTYVEVLAAALAATVKVKMCIRDRG